jgi:hypothetical protein
MKICLIFAASVLIFSCNNAIAQSQKDEEFGQFVTFYYKNPDVNKVPDALATALGSEFINDDKSCDEHCKDLIAYFFARVAREQPSLWKSYKTTFEKASHEQRLFLLRVFRFSSVPDIEQYCKQKLSDSNFTSEQADIRKVLEANKSKDFNPLNMDITDAGVLDFLWEEFFVTGSKEPVKRIISVLPLWRTGKDIKQRVIAGAARWSLGSNCRQHDKVLEICKQELEKSNWPQKQLLRDIVLRAQNKKIPDTLSGQKMTKIVTRNISAGIDKKSFAAQPVTLYKAGTGFARLEEMPDPENKIHGLIIADSPEYWMINLWDKTGKYILDADPNSKFHLPIVTIEDKTQKISELEFGSEMNFLEKNKAQKNSIDRDGKQLDKYHLDVNGYKIELIADKDVPQSLTVLKDANEVVSIVYDEYRRDLDPNMGLFEVPYDVEIRQGNQK